MDDVEAYQLSLTPIFNSGNPNTLGFESTRAPYFDTSTTPYGHYVNQDIGVTTGWVLINPQPEP